jgi:glycosyltransferase involved in cell wall biosynthesis
MVGGLHASITGNQRGYYEGAAIIAVHNRALRDSFIANGYRPEKVLLVPLGVDTERFAVREGGSGSTARPSILYVGRVDRSKGVDLLIRAVAALRATQPTLTLTIIGPAANADRLGELQQLVADLSLERSVTFVGAVAYEALPSHYRAASILVLPSRNEGFGMVLVESMACGTPVVALKNSGGPDDIITDGVDGLLVSETELADRLRILLASPARLAAMGAAARQTVVQRFGTAVTTSAFEEIFFRAQSGQALLESKERPLDPAKRQ